MNEADKIAAAVRNYVALEPAFLNNAQPPQLGVIVRWRDQIRVGGIAEMRNDGICLLSLGSYSVSQAFVNELCRVSPGRLIYDAEGSLDLSGRQHIVARFANRIQRMTPEQIRWAEVALDNVIELGGAGRMQGVRA